MYLLKYFFQIPQRFLIKMRKCCITTFLDQGKLDSGLDSRMRHFATSILGHIVHISSVKYNHRNLIGTERTSFLLN